MSGRWRSRHWQPGDGGASGGSDGDLRDRRRDHSRERQHQNNNFGQNNRRGSGEQDIDYNDQRDYDQYRNNNSSEYNQQQRWGHSNSGMSDERGAWRRGQSVPNNSVKNTQHDVHRNNNGQQKQQRIKQEPKPTDNRSGSTGRNSTRPVFSAPPAQAWGNNNTDQGVSASGNNRDAISTNNNTEKRGWTKPDSSHSNVVGTTETKQSAPANAWGIKQQPGTSSLQKAAAHSSVSSSSNQFPTGIMKRREDSGIEKKSSNPWAKPNDTNPNPNAIDNSAFPPPSSTEGSIKKQSSLSTAAVKDKVGRQWPSTLPSTTSWGKSVSNISSQSQNLNKKKKKVKVEEFPSLSTASKIPQTQQVRPQAAKAVTPSINNEKAAAKGKGSSKKTATTANLASFLSPQLSGSSGGSGKNTKKKQQPSKQSASLASFNRINKSHTTTSSMVGKKRSAEADDNHFPNMPTKGGVKKGRQRIAPRKKKLTTLKKKVLKERLRVWKERNGIVDDKDNNDDDDDDNIGVTADQPSTKRLKTGALPPEVSSIKLFQSTTLLLENFIRPDEDDLTDDDEYDEIISNLISLAGRVGKVISVFVPRPQQQESGMDGEDSLETNNVGLAFVRYMSNNDICAAKDILHGMVVGGQKICATVLDAPELLQFSDTIAHGKLISAENDKQWHAAALKVVEGRSTLMDVSSHAVESTAVQSTAVTIVFHKILCDDDYEDKDALQESIEDIKALSQQFGQVVNARASTSGNDKGNVYIAYGTNEAADKALQQLNGIVVGGSKILVSRDTEQQQSKVGEIVLSNVLNEDDFEDEDCLNESLDDIRTLAEQCGVIGSIRAELTGEDKGKVYVSYPDGHEIAKKAAQKINGMVIGGLIISASLVVASTNNSTNTTSDVPMQEEKEVPPPMYSGDKIVPERFAACKRVPKVPNRGTPRAYASKIADESATPLLIDMLGELMRLQERSKDDKNARARRRLVMGLREVARGIRAHKVKMVIMANNLDDYGAIDSKLQEILDLAKAENLPIVYELNKRKLGKALGKSIKVAVVGIQNADGAHEQFKKLKKLLGMA